MKKTTEEYFCDFCGAKCTDKHYDFVLPQKLSDMNHNDTYSYNPILPAHKDLCVSCARKLSKFHDDIEDYVFKILM